jgi:putative ABC transport system substrate-binding protein
MRRRDLIKGLVGSAAAWSLAARAQQTDQVRRIGVLWPWAESDPVARSWATAFATRLRELGWVEGSNLRIDHRWAGGDMTRITTLAKELVELQPDVLLGTVSTAALVLRQYTLAIPIVFVQTTDPVASGLVTNLARPEGNTTGFAVAAEFGIGGKWLEMLKECAPGLNRAALLFDPATPTSAFYVRAMEPAARSLGVQLLPFPMQSDADIERAFAEFAVKPHGGIITLATGSTLAHRGRIIALAAQYRLPATYPFRFFVTDGGLMSYGVDVPELYRQAATYVDRILKGAKLADLPVQQPTKYELVINRKTAAALGLVIPDKLLSTADEVIE